MTKLQGLPVANHPLFPEFWNRRANSFNALADKLDEVRIDVAELREVVEAVEDVERLSFQYMTGGRVA